MLGRGSGFHLQAASQQQRASCIQPPVPHLSLRNLCRLLTPSVAAAG